ncbi:hypothetical protein [Microcoleus vaginatus]|uniref:hypothetical protein n=1 Tax=Microcoleus vaginatus TaxID=119532 RepID=UPI001F60DCC6
MTEDNQGEDLEPKVAFFTGYDFLTGSLQSDRHILASSGMINITSFYSSGGNLSPVLSDRLPHFTIAVQFCNLYRGHLYKRQTIRKLGRCQNIDVIEKSEQLSDEKLAQDVPEPSFVDTPGGANLRSSRRDGMAVVSQRPESRQ